MIIKLLTTISFIFLTFCAEVQSMEPVIKILRPKTGTANLLQNGNFDRVEEGKIKAWEPWRQGYKVAKRNVPLTRHPLVLAVLCTSRSVRQIQNQNAASSSVKRRVQSERSAISGTTVVYCNSTAGREQYGIGQSVDLDREDTISLSVSGWSKAKNVSGGRNSGYSVYVDIIYQDGTELWGQAGKFNTGTHDWEMQKFVIVPAKPIKRFSIYGLFRGHTGEAWFDDFQVSELGNEDTATLDSVPVELPKKQKISEETMELLEISTKDGLNIRYNWNQGKVASLKLDSEELARNVPSGFLVRDVDADSDFYQFKDGECTDLDLNLDAKIEGNENCVVVSGSLTRSASVPLCTTGDDRAVTLIFALPIDAVGWRWHDDIRNSRLIEEGQEYVNCVNIHTGLNGMMSLYPFASINDQDHGLALALDMDIPAQYRIGYNASIKQFFIAYDFGLTKDTDNFPSTAPFRFVIYRTDPKWGFRSAAKKLYELFPAQFVCRSKDQGIWMPFTDVSTVEGWEDFGFKYHEGINNVPFDDHAGILSFRYTEPSTWWMKIDPSVERTHENILELLHEKAGAGNRQAKAVLSSGSFDEYGRYQYLIRDTPWCNGAVFSSNPNPNIPENSEAKMCWNEEIKQRLYGPDAKGEQDGEYLDSLEAYVTADENFRSSHFRYATIPLTFSTVSKKPVIHKAFSIYEFTKWLAKELHEMDKLLFANSVPHRFAFLCPLLDIMGTETNWIDRDGNWKPASDSWMNFKRAMCYQKPYLFLMNTDYDKFTSDLVEKYLQRCLFYGMFPSMFSHNAAENPYWRAPKWYNRDRQLFKRYIPIIKKVAESGWEPLTLARTDNEAVYVERFGPDPEGNLFFTLLNDSAEIQQTVLTIMSNELELMGVEEAKDWVSGESMKSSVGEQMKIAFSMLPEQVRLMHFRSN